MVCITHVLEGDFFSSISQLNHSVTYLRRTNGFLILFCDYADTGTSAGLYLALFTLACAPPTQFPFYGYGIILLGLEGPSVKLAV